MRTPFAWVYAAAIALLVIDFWLVGLAVESGQFAALCVTLAAIGLLGNFLLTHGKNPSTRWFGFAIWVGGLSATVFLLSGQLTPLTVLATAPPDIAWLIVVSLVTVLITFLLGRYWGQFYAALSFVVVPTLSLFGLIVPVYVNTEMVVGFVAALVLGLFLVSAESLLIRWQRGQLGTVTPPMFLRYCWRLALGASAVVLTLGLLLVPPVSLLQEPLSRQLMRLPRIQFATYTGNTVQFPDVFTMPGGPINLPDTMLYQVTGTTYPRWRVRAYVHYLGSGWRVSSLDSAAQPPLSVRETPDGVELIWERRTPRRQTLVVSALVASLVGAVNEMPSPGIAQRVRVLTPSPLYILRTPSGSLLSLTRLNTDRYIVTARPVPETPPPAGVDPPLSPIEEQVLTAFPPYLYRVAQLARQVTADLISPYSKAKALEAFLQTHYRYSDNPPPAWRSRRDVVSFFLFEAREGACDWFASALALMCRAVGIPARVVTGFYSDETTADGILVIRASHAHAWVEAYIDGHGWVTLDATPSGAISRRSALLNRLQQWLARSYRLSLVNPNFVWWLVAVLWLAVAFPMAFQVVRWTWAAYRPKPAWRHIVDAYRQAIKVGQRCGLPVQPAATPWENAARCAATPRFPVAGKNALKQLSDLTVRVLYANAEPTDDDVNTARNALRVFREQARRYARWFVRPRRSWQMLREWLERW